MFLDIFGFIKDFFIVRENSRYYFMVQFNFIFLDFIDSNDEVIYKDFFYKLKILINIEIEIILVENLVCQNDGKFWVIG